MRSERSQLNHFRKKSGQQFLDKTKEKSDLEKVQQIKSQLIKKSETAIKLKFLTNVNLNLDKIPEFQESNIIPSSGFTTRVPTAMYERQSMTPQANEFNLVRAKNKKFFDHSTSRRIVSATSSKD